MQIYTKNLYLHNLLLYEIKLSDITIVVSLTICIPNPMIHIES